MLLAVSLSKILNCAGALDCKVHIQLRWPRNLLYGAVINSIFSSTHNAVALFSLPKSLIAYEDWVWTIGLCNYANPLFSSMPYISEHFCFRLIWDDLTTPTRFYEGGTADKQKRKYEYCTACREHMDATNNCTTPIRQDCFSQLLTSVH